MKSLILAAIILISASAHAFTLTSQGVKGWDTHTLTFHLNRANCPGNIDSLVNGALTLWNSAAASALTIKVADDSSATPAQALAGTTNENPVIVCDPAFAATFSASNGVAGVGFNRPNSSGVIVSGALALNVQTGTAGNIAVMDETSAQIVLAHEIGHVLGLGHSSETYALMYYDVGAKTNLSFSADDYNGLLYLYGRDEWGKDTPMGGCGLVSGAPKPPTGKMIFVYLLFLLAPIALWSKQKFSRA